MEFFNSAIDVLQTLVIALGAGLGIWGVINLLVLFVLLGGGAAFYYFKFVKPKHNVKGSTDLEDFDFEDYDEDEPEADTGEVSKEEETEDEEV